MANLQSSNDAYSLKIASYIVYYIYANSWRSVVCFTCPDIVVQMYISDYLPNQNLKNVTMDAAPLLSWNVNIRTLSGPYTEVDLILMCFHKSYNAFHLVNAVFEITFLI